MADNKVENTEVTEEVCTKEKAVVDEKKVEEVVEDAKCEKEEKTENGDSKEENGKATEEAEDEAEDEKEKTACKRKSTTGDKTDGVTVDGTPEKKQKLDDKASEDVEKETAEVTA